jgi:HlyD family secretion protein
VLTETEFNEAEYARAVAQADAKSAQVAVDRARRNLAYTRIYAPIDGVVVERNVDVGQTVAASFSAPQLFLIAQDLSEMEILAAVDESDIGEIDAGQAVTFTVQAYPDTTFTGTVRQVRLQSTTTENIVNYTAVVQVANPSGELLPGMTATVSFLTGSATDVLTVPNSALRYQPSETVLSESDVAPAARIALNGPSTEPQPTLVPRQSTAEPGPPFGGGSSSARSTSTSRAEDHGALWYMDERGRLDVLSVAVGVSDGRRTEVSGSGLREGTHVIVGTGTASSSTSEVVSPLQSARQSGPPRPGF